MLRAQRRMYQWRGRSGEGEVEEEADHQFVKRSSEDDSRTGSPCPKI
jgi:hypothetical protein